MDTKLDLPPQYSNSSIELPKSFLIGPHNVPPLMDIADLQAHLRLLGAFSTLKDSVVSQSESITDKERAWVIYVNRAVHRFNSFVGVKWPKEFKGWSGANLPPLDVLMVLHSYMLNPRTFHEDTVRRTSFFSRNLAAIGSFPLSLVAASIDEKTLYAIPPSAEQEVLFTEITQEPFICPLSTSPLDTVSLSCPCCDNMIHSIPWVTDEDTGFAQPNFTFGCPNCKKPFTRSMMGIRRFADEVTRRRANRRVYFSETLVDPKTGKYDDSVADMFIVRLLRRIVNVHSLPKTCEQDRISLEARDLAAGLKWSTDVLAEQLQVGLRPKAEFKPDEIIPRVQRIVAAYSLAGPASLDLVGAVLRQSTFIEKMVELGWAKPSSMAHEHLDMNLARSIARYHAFLDLLSQSAHDFFVPTLDIDLSWHTHQLQGPAYREETLKLLNRTPNHDDTVEQNTLQSGYDDTAKAWKARFGVPYSVCGCMPDVEPEKVQEKKSSVKKMFSMGPKPVAPPVVKVKRTGPHPELVNTSLSDADASHPSEHYLHRKVGDETSVKPDAVGREIASKQRAAKIIAAPPGKDIDEWHKLQAERKNTRHHREAFTGTDDQERYPYWGVSANVPFGFWGACKYDNAIGGCSTSGATCSIGLGRDSNWEPSQPWA